MNFAMLVTLCIVLFEFLVVKTSCSVIVGLEANGSLILGRKLFTEFDNRPFIAFYNVPYAEPPVGSLRFQPPKPCKWLTKELQNYSKPPAETCGLEYDEDVLYLTVYMPDDVTTESYPVVVWLHELSSYHGPDFLIDEDIIVVTISFRTSIFGFLNTEDFFAKGNMAAKDIITGLKWIRDHIAHFNGDPNRVTVIGSGVAADIVASFPLSPLADDLFARVVIESGSALNPAIYNVNSVKILNRLYWNLWGWGEKFDRTRLYDLLQSASAKKLIMAADDLFDSSEVRDKQRLINEFGPSLEVFGKGAFMNEDPGSMFEEGEIHNSVDVMIGYTNLESLHLLDGFVSNKKLLKHLNHNFQYLVPFEGKSHEYRSKTYNKIKQEIMDFYFINGTIRELSLKRYGKYLSDQVIYPVLRHAKLHARKSRNHVYLYRFSYKGSLNIVWNSVFDGLGLSGATAGDEICYQFKCKSSHYKASNERHFIKKIARLLANFAKFGNPTPQENGILGDLKWEPLDYKGGDFRGLNLGKIFKMVKVPEVKRFMFWEQLRKKHYNGNEELLRDEL